MKIHLRGSNWCGPWKKRRDSKTCWLVTGLGERAEVGIYRAQSGTPWANWLEGNSWKEKSVEDLGRTWRSWLPGWQILDLNGGNADPWWSQSRAGTQASKWTERYTGIGISCNLEGLGLWSSLETMVMAWARDQEGVGRQSTGIFQEIFMETSFELKYIWGELCRAHLFFISHSFTCLILCMNKQAEYITNNYKIKSVNWVIRKILQVTGGKIKTNEAPLPQTPKHVSRTQ